MSAWWNPRSWFGSAVSPALRPPIQIDERQIAVARPGDLVIVTMPEHISPNERMPFLEYVGQMAKSHGVRVWILDRGFAVTVVRSEPQ